MKKIISVLVLSFLVLGLVACTNKTESLNETPKENNNPDIIEPAPEIVIDPNYIQEFPYIHKHEGMVLQDFYEGENGEFSEAIYNLEGIKFENYLEEYKEILIKDGWEVIDDNPPEKLSVKKDDKTAIFLLSESESGILMMILSK